MPFSSIRDRLHHSHGSSSSIHAPDRSSSAGSVPSKQTSRDSQSDSSSLTPSLNAAFETLKTQHLSADPVQFIQDALTPVMTYNAKYENVSIDDIMEYHMPRYFAPDYNYQFNCNEMVLATWGQKMKKIRDHVKKMRVRFIRHTMDTSERQSMQKACVSINYELVITTPEREDEIRCHANGIYLIEHGKIQRAMMVCDMHEFSMKSPEAPACIIS